MILGALGAITSVLMLIALFALPSQPTVQPAPAPATPTATAQPSASPTPTAVPSPPPTDTPTPDLASQLEAALTEAYGYPTDPAFENVQAITADGDRAVIITNLADKPENEQPATELCMLTISVADAITAPFRGTYVTAGEGGAFLATCDT